MTDYLQVTKRSTGVVWLPIDVSYREEMKFKDVIEHVRRLYSTHDFIGSHVSCKVKGGKG